MQEWPARDADLTSGIEQTTEEVPSVLRRARSGGAYCYNMLRFAPRAWRDGCRHYVAIMSKLKEGLEALRKTYRAFQAPVAKNEGKTPSAYHSSEPVAFSYGNPDKAAQVFGTRTCSFTHRALELLEDKEIDTTFVDLGLPGAGAMRRELTDETGQRTVPYVFLRGKFIGGYSELDQARRMGMLEATTGTPLASVSPHGEG